METLKIPHVTQHFELVEVACIRRVRRKRDQKHMAVDNEMTQVVRDVHIVFYLYKVRKIFCTINATKA